MEAKDYLTAIRATGMTQAEVSTHTGIPQPTISKIERGEVEDVMSRNYRALQALHRKVVRKAKPLATEAATAEPTTTEA